MAKFKTGDHIISNRRDFIRMYRIIEVQFPGDSYPSYLLKNVTGSYEKRSVSVVDYNYKISLSKILLNL